MPADVGRRICVLGTSGSGKSYVAQALAQRLDIPYVCNDAIIWRADWQVTPAAERFAEFDTATRREAWVFDGNLNAGPTSPDHLNDDGLILSRCDTLVWLDLPRVVVMWQVIARTLRRIVRREHLWHDNVEGWHTFFARDNIVWWAWKTYARRRRNYAALFADPAFADHARIRLRSRREVNAWLRRLSRSRAPA